MTPLRVLIADDHPLVRSGLRSLLQGMADVSLVGEARDGHEAVRLAAELAPDVVVMDINMPGVNGIEATGRIVSDVDRVAVLILTMYEDDDLVFSAMRAGARGYILKGSSPEDVGRAIRSVAAGEVLLGAAVARRVVGYFSGELSNVAPFPELSDREQQTLDLLAQGLSNREIASKLYLGEKTIRNYVSDIYSKLQVASRAEAVVKAREAGLGRSSS